MVERYGVGRKTMRQTFALLVQEGLLTARRGAGGGYIGCRPSVSHVIDTASLYLTLSDATLDDLYQTSNALAQEVCRLAAGSCSQEARAALIQRRHDFAALPATSSAEEAGLLEQSMLVAVGDLAGNPMMSLFLDILYRYGERFSERRPAGSGQNVIWHTARLSLVDAVLEGDVEAAVVLWQGFNRMRREL